jgi:hypothetical protein
MAARRVVIANLSRSVLPEAGTRYPLRVLNITAPIEERPVESGDADVPASSEDAADPLQGRKIPPLLVNTPSEALRPAATPGVGAVLAGRYRLEALLMPRLIAARGMKRYPEDIGLAYKLGMNLKIYGRIALDLVTRS